MAIVTPQLLLALFTGFNAAFQRAQTDTPTSWQKIATEVPSTTKSNTYGWLGQFPKFREWVGDRVFNDMKAHAYTITNKDWESSVSVKRPDIEDDEVGVYMPLFTEMGRAVTTQPDELVFELLKAGLTTLCYDGQNFFDTDHPVYPNVDGTGVPTLVANVDNSGAAGAPYWYLLDTTKSLKPLIFQNRKKAVLTPMTKLDDEGVFKSNVFRFGADSRNNVGFGFWQLAYASNAPLTPENYGKARAALKAMKADGGRPLGITPNLLVVPPALEAAGRSILVKDKDGGNEWAGTAELLDPAWL